MILKKRSKNSENFHNICGKELFLESFCLIDKLVEKCDEGIEGDEMFYLMQL